MTRTVTAAGRFLWDFVVGDDWVGAAGVAVTLATVAVIVTAGVNPWWATPAAVVATLATTLRRAVRAAAGERPPG
jgi:hypothetical protein